jgi:hypothetical protein
MLSARGGRQLEQLYNVGLCNVKSEIWYCSRSISDLDLCLTSMNYIFYIYESYSNYNGLIVD